MLDHVTGKIDREEKVTIDGVVGVKLTYKQVVVIDKLDVSQVIINKNNRDYIVRALATDINQILSTFKFLENGEIPSNKTCQYNGITYQDGESVPDKCNYCSCESGQIACTLRACQ